MKYIPLGFITAIVICAIMIAMPEVYENSLSSFNPVNNMPLIVDIAILSLFIALTSAVTWKYFYDHPWITFTSFIILTPFTLNSFARFMNNYLKGERIACGDYHMETHSASIAFFLFLLLAILIWGIYFDILKYIAWINSKRKLKKLENSKQ